MPRRSAPRCCARRWGSTVSPFTPASSGPEDGDVTASLDDLRRETGRQLEHWRLAADRLGNLDAVAPASAWRSLEHYLGVALRQTLREIVARLRRTADDIARRLARARSPEEVAAVRVAMLGFRRTYTRAETSVDFFEDALS